MSQRSNARSKSFHVVRDGEEGALPPVCRDGKAGLSALKVWGGIANLCVYCQRMLALETGECLRFSPNDRVSLNWVRDKDKRQTIP